MTVTYRDELGVVTVEVDDGQVNFLDGYAYFTSELLDYKVNASFLIDISTEAVVLPF